MTTLKAVLAPIAVLLATATGPATGARSRAALPPVAENDNRVAAGTMKNGVLELSLDARPGDWRPYRENGPPVQIVAFGETGKPLQMPGPMIRVIAGARVHARVHNSAATTLVVHGLASRHRTTMDTLVVPAGATRQASFMADEPGTFFYWGTTAGVAFDDRLFDDAELSGALIVDSVGARPGRDRVFVVQWYIPGVLKDSTPNAGNSFFTFNGRPWPYTERLTYSQGDSVHWRFINATPDVHPLHLHGFYFRVNARGDFQRDTVYWKAQQRMGVTELMAGGTTMDMSWLADRPGGWIFHCHLNFHVVPNPTLGSGMLSDSARVHELFAAPTMPGMGDGHAMGNHAEKGMGGLLLAMTIKPSAAWKAYTGPRERLRLFIQTDSLPGDTARKFGYALAHGNEIPPEHAIRWPGPPIILHRSQPASIWVVNHIAEPSQVHWHGLEIDSYYDGVAGLSTSGGMVSPMIMPRDSFEVTVTPPRAGSFMYHTHINDLRQQSHGLYGPIIVLDSGQTFDPESDLIFLVGTNVADNPVLNGGDSLLPAMTLKSGKPYRVRLMNITLDMPNNQFWLSAADASSPQWVPLAKDGFDLPVWQRTSRFAHQRVSIGETYDFQVTFPVPGAYAFEGRFGDGAIYARQPIHVVK